MILTLIAAAAMIIIIKDHTANMKDWTAIRNRYADNANRSQ